MHLALLLLLLRRGGAAGVWQLGTSTRLRFLHGRAVARGSSQPAHVGKQAICTCHSKNGVGEEEEGAVARFLPAIVSLDHSLRTGYCCTEQSSQPISIAISPAYSLG